MSGDGLSMTTLARVRDGAALISSLPAAPTFGWCSRAAGCLSAIGDGLVLVTVGGLAPDGRILAFGQFGLAAPAMGDGVPEPPAIRDLRNGVARLQTLGFAPPDVARWGDAGLVERHGRGWSTGPVGRLWSAASVGELLTASCVLDAECRRVLLAYIGPHGDTGEAVMVVRAVLPLLAMRARAALGNISPNRRTWITVREQVVLDQLAAGHSVQEITLELGRSRHTVLDHIKALRRKVGAGSRAELVARVLGRGVPLAPPGTAAEFVDYTQTPARTQGPPAKTTSTSRTA